MVEGAHEPTEVPVEHQRQHIEEHCCCHGEQERSGVLEEWKGWGEGPNMFVSDTIQCALVGFIILLPLFTFHYESNFCM